MAISTIDPGLTPGQTRVDPHEVAADGPAPRTDGMAREAETERERRAAAVGCDTTGARSVNCPARLAADDAPRQSALDRSRSMTACRPRTPASNSAAGGDGLLAAASQSSSRRRIARPWTPSGYRPSTRTPRSPVTIMPSTRSPRASTSRARPSRRRIAERAGIDRVAAQLVARKRRPIDNAHARAGPRQHEAGNRAGGASADDEDIITCSRTGELADRCRRAVIRRQTHQSPLSTNCVSRLCRSQRRCSSIRSRDNCTAQRRPAPRRPSSG